jgi:hypothetical protein
MGSLPAPLSHKCNQGADSGRPAGLVPISMLSLNPIGQFMAVLSHSTAYVT